jgi:hypothetical protein
MTPMPLRAAPLLVALAGVAAGTAPPTAPPAVPFLEDDYDKALAQARERNLPIFVEAWAPW